MFKILHFIEVKVRKLSFGQFRWPFYGEENEFWRNRPLVFSAGASGFFDMHFTAGKIAIVLAIMARPIEFFERDAGAP